MGWRYGVVSYNWLSFGGHVSLSEIENNIRHGLSEGKDSDGFVISELVILGLRSGEIDEGS